MLAAREAWLRAFSAEAVWPTHVATNVWPTQCVTHPIQYFAWAISASNSNSNQIVEWSKCRFNHGKFFVALNQKVKKMLKGKDHCTALVGSQQCSVGTLSPPLSLGQNLRVFFCDGRTHREEFSSSWILQMKGGQRKGGAGFSVWGKKVKDKKLSKEHLKSKYYIKCMLPCALPLSF